MWETPGGRIALKMASWSEEGEERRLLTGTILLTEQTKDIIVQNLQLPQLFEAGYHMTSFLKLPTKSPMNSVFKNGIMRACLTLCWKICLASRCWGQDSHWTLSKTSNKISRRYQSKTWWRTFVKVLLGICSNNNLPKPPKQQNASDIKGHIFNCCPF